MEQLNSKVVYILLIILLYVQLSKNASIDNNSKFNGDQGLYMQTDDVEILTVDNFKSAIVGSKRAWLVEFYNSWCGFCQRFAPSWKEFGTDVKSWRELIVVAALDCANEQNNVLCREYEIMSYPTLRYFPEGFKEAPKSYGFNMKRGTTATDHRQDLVQKIKTEQSEGRGKQFPNLQPFIGNNIEDIFDGTSLSIQYAVLIIQEPESLLGSELLLDFHKTPGAIIKYSLSNNTKLLNSLPSEPLPSAYIIGQDKKPIVIVASSKDRKGLKDAIKHALEERNISVVNEKGTNNAKEPQHIDNDVAMLEKVKKMGDVVFQMDLETALRYSLKREVGGTKEISGEKLDALRKYLQVLAKYFPFGRNGKILLQEILTYAESSDVIQGANIGKLVKEAEKEEKQVFSTPQKWLGCQGSSPQYRGYPCGLWKMFHYLTINVADYELGIREDNPRLALEAMHGYIKNFFGCTDCSQHFQEMAVRREWEKVASFDDSILWLWEAHNEVNKRLSGDATEDPEFPKVEFPTKKTCPTCRDSDGAWVPNEVLRHLKHMYNSVNIRYLGADTDVIYHLGLGSNSNTTHAGLQEETVQIQTRPIGKSLSNGTVYNGTSSKANYLIMFFSLLTYLYVWQ